MTSRYLWMAVVLLSTTLLTNHVSQAYSESQKDTPTAKDKSVKESQPYSVGKIIKYPLRGKTNWWVYGIQICTNDKVLGLTEIIFSSDIEVIHEGMNASIRAEKCQYFGAVMKVKDDNTLKYRIVTNEEAYQKINNAKQGNLNGTSWDEISRWMAIHRS